MAVDFSFERMFDRCEPAKHMLVAIPSYTGKVSIETVSSILSTVGLSCRLEFRSISRDCYIDRGRNALVTDFLLESDATDLLFLDDDVGFPPDGLARIAAARRPIVGGVYPKKQDGLEEPFPMTFCQGEIKSDEEGLVEVAMLPTGFLRINRGVFDLMPYTVYPGLNDRKTLGFFATQQNGEKRVGGWKDAEVTGSYTGEDVAFCWEWKRRGGKIYVIPDLEMTHTGLKTWKGNLHEHLVDKFKEK